VANEVEQQIERYFGWLEARSGTQLHRERDGSGLAAVQPVAVDEIREIVELEVHLRIPSARPHRRFHRVLAASAALGVVCLVVGLVLLATWRSERTVEIRGSAVPRSIDVASVPPADSVVDVPGVVADFVDHVRKAEVQKALDLLVPGSPAATKISAFFGTGMVFTYPDFVDDRNGHYFLGLHTGAPWLEISDFRIAGDGRITDLAIHVGGVPFDPSNPARFQPRADRSD
jgi:hypothetical protein